MRRMTSPSISAREVLLACAEVVQQDSLRIRLFGAADEVEAMETMYNKQGAMSRLDTIPSTETVGDWVDGSEMVTLYSGTLSRLDAPVRHIYDQLKAAARHGICPFCGQRVVRTLDHYLPKVTHPGLAVTPLNLLPSCGDCNWEKSTHVATTPVDLIFHPYFDDADDGDWLVATVEHKSPPGLLFGVAHVAHWNEVKCKRMKKHFDTLGLAILYGSHAGSELENLRYNLQRLRTAAGPDGVRDHLREQETGRRLAHRNSWQAAFYGALATSNWFCDVGVNQI